MGSLALEISEYAKRQPEGHPIVAKELLHLGNRAAIDQSLSRMAREGVIIRAGRGTYVVPVEGRFGSRPPVPGKVVHEFARQHGETVASQGATVANEFGLTTQVPVREMYLTSGRTRRLSVGKQTVELKKAPAWKQLLPGHRAGDAIRALDWAGRDHATETFRLLAQKLPSELEELRGVRARLPGWMAEVISAELPDA